MKSRIHKYKSTVFRANMPPGPLLCFNPKVVALLDGESFATLFNTNKVEKKDLFTGIYMPSTNLTGGYRTLSYLDLSEPDHASLKKLMFFMFSHRQDHVIPEFHSSYTELFEGLERNLATKGKADLSAANDHAAFNFLAQAFYGINLVDTGLGSDGLKLISHRCCYIPRKNC